MSQENQCKEKKISQKYFTV